MPELIRLTLDESAHNSDVLLLHGWDAAQPVIAFIRRRADHSKVLLWPVSRLGHWMLPARHAYC